MDIRNGSFLLLYHCSLFILIQKTAAGGSFQIKLHNYTNPDGTTASGSLCDGIPSDPCDHVFSFCLTSTTRGCSIARFRTDAVQDMNIIHVFSSSIFPHLSFQIWPVDLQIHVDVVDKDPDDGTEEEVDTLYTSLHVIPPVSDIVITLSDRTTLLMTMSVKCDVGYYGVACSTFCEPLEDDHYNCDSDGKKICHPGWQGDSCTDLDPCGSYPCQNNGSCANLLHTFNCSCTEYFSGTFCETKLIQTTEIHTTTEDMTTQMTTVVTVTTGGSLISTLTSPITDIVATSIDDLTTKFDNIDTTFADSTSMSTVTEPYSAGQTESSTIENVEVTEKTNVLTTPSYHETDQMNRSPTKEYTTANESNTTEKNVHNITTRADNNYSTLLRNNNYNNNEEYLTTVSNIGNIEVIWSETDPPDKKIYIKRIVTEKDLFRNSTTVFPIERFTYFNKVVVITLGVVIGLLVIIILFEILFFCHKCHERKMNYCHQHLDNEGCIEHNAKET